MPTNGMATTRQSGSGCDTLARTVALRRVHSSLGREAQLGAKRDRGSGSGLLVPAEDTQRPQRVPPAGPTVAVLEREVDLAGMRVLQQPGAIGLLLGSEQVDRFVHPRVRHIPGRAEVFEGAQHVVVPAGRKRELQPGWVDDFAGALTSEQLPFEEVLLTPAPSRDGFRRATVARSYANSPSRTLIVVGNEERMEPFSPLKSG